MACNDSVAETAAKAQHDPHAPYAVGGESFLFLLQSAY
jgi:hypothetical protein